MKVTNLILLSKTIKLIFVQCFSPILGQTNKLNGQGEGKVKRLNHSQWHSSSPLTSQRILKTQIWCSPHHGHRLTKRLKEISLQTSRLITWTDWSIKISRLIRGSRTKIHRNFTKLSSCQSYRSVVCPKIRETQPLNDRKFQAEANVIC